VGIGIYAGKHCFERCSSVQSTCRWSKMPNTLGSDADLTPAIWELSNQYDLLLNSNGSCHLIPVVIVLNLGYRELLN